MADDFVLFKKRIHTKIGLDLNCYKERQLKRRILQFMARYNAATFSHLLQLLELNGELLLSFKEFLTINTSEFFRDANVFNYIENTVMREFATTGEPVKIWSAGCSIGAEPYSLAILSREAQLKRFHILATDYDGKALDKAKAGVYSPSLLKNVPAELVSRYFDFIEGKYVVKHILKQDVVFKEQNLLSDVFPPAFDLILCRNVFIYFTQEAQAALVSRFLRSLKQGGYLITGSSEFISAPESLGCKRCAHAIYQKR
jgi:chemotaxis protein methyltransferase CheR